MIYLILSIIIFLGVVLAAVRTFIIAAEALESELSNEED